jgi:TATA-binding protein-associated factor
MARLVGVPHFFTEQSYLEEKEDAAAIRRAKKLDDDGQSVRSLQVLSVRRMQKQFLGSILRRTTDSKNWNGQTLLDLPPHEDIMGVLTLTERETQIINERAEAAKARYGIRSWTFIPSSYTSYSIMSANETGRFQTRV